MIRLDGMKHYNSNQHPTAIYSDASNFFFVSFVKLKFFLQFTDFKTAIIFNKCLPPRFKTAFTAPVLHPIVKQYIASSFYKTHLFRTDNTWTESRAGRNPETLLREKHRQV